MQQLRWIHRLVTAIIVVFALYLGLTGTTIQLIDLKTLYSHAPATDPNLRAIREAFDGPGSYQVRETKDYLAAPLPAGSDYAAMMRAALAAARKALGAAPLKYVELRMIGSRPVGQVGVGAGHARFDIGSGALLERTAHDRPDAAPPESLRNDIKHLHRMTTFGDWALIINVVVSLGLTVLIVTGLWIYVKLLLGRRRIKRNGVFWSGGGTWRMLHRSISIAASGLLLGVTLSGAWLAVESAGLAISMARQHHAGQPQAGADPISPIEDAAVPGMIAATLKALHRDAPRDPVKVIRLRIYARYLQGVVVTGGSHSRQLVYNTRTGQPMSETEPGYPKVGFPFGWQAHQIAKSVHRGDFLGLPGRWMDLLAGLSMIYLSVSGMVMYWQMWRRRAAAGRRSIMWK